jgi:sensor histidine kinase YesM
MLLTQVTGAEFNRAIVNNSDTLYAGRFVGEHLQQKGQYDHYLPILFKAKSPTNILFKSYNKSDYTFHSRVILEHPDRISRYLDKWMINNSRGAYVNIFFLGVVVALLLYFGMLSFFSPRKDFIIYAIYLACVFIHYMLSTDTNMRLDIFFPNEPINNILINDFTLNIMYAVYIYFAYSFLEVNQHDKLVKKFLFFQIGLHIILALFISYFLISTRAISYTRNHIYDLYFIAFFVSVISMILIYFRIPGKVKYFVIVGSLFLSIASLLEVLNDTHIYRWFEFTQGEHRFLSFNVTQVGIFLELICFSLGIGYKHNRAFQEKESAQQAYITQLQKNQELQDKYTDELQQEVQIQAKELIKEREIGLKRQYDNRIMQLESDMLLSQMNPHFIFNSLNSIKYFALSKTLEETADYITDFSKLMRMILQNSRSKFITLEKEIEFLNLYLRIESRRHDRAFEYSVISSKDINLLIDQIPAMLIQPMVENAIVHGLLQKPTPGRVDVFFNKDSGHIIIDVVDDGIGRKAAALKRNKNKLYKQSSLGTAITKERLDLLNDLNDINASLEIVDLYDGNGLSVGTHAQIKIPYMT